jgi:hypothetical protein
MMTRQLFCFISLLVLVSAVQAQTFRLQGHMQGGCAVELLGQSEKGRSWEGFFIMAEADTFYWEGLVQSDTLVGLMAVQGNIAGQFFLRPYANDLWIGGWQSRTHDAIYPLFLSGKANDEWNWQFLKEEKPTEELSHLHVSRVARGQWRGQVFDEEAEEWHDFDWLRGVGHSGPDGLSDILRQWEMHDSLRQGYPLNVYRSCDSLSLTEVSLPDLPYAMVVDSLAQWKKQWLQRLEKQKKELLAAGQAEEIYESLWAFHAYAFVEIYTDDPKILSFALHSRDFEGKNKVETWHYLPKKEEFTDWSEQTWRTSKFFERLEIDPKTEVRWVFHPKGPIAIWPAQAGQGIRTSHVPRSDIKRYYRWFSSFRSVK